jgi:hypothetical protein
MDKRRVLLPLLGWGAIINSALFLALSFVYGVARGLPLTPKMAIVTAAVTFFSYSMQIADAPRHHQFFYTLSSVTLGAFTLICVLAGV